jgi:hypothetical protein
MKKIHQAKEFWIIAGSVIIVAAILALLDKSGHILQGWLAYGILLGLGAASIYGMWRSVSATRQVMTIALISVSLRLTIGVALMLMLPIFGYQTSQEHQAGYVYNDAYVRDNQAWNLAISGESVTTAFSGEIPGDQYGGMLAVSALIYRFLSPDAHRPFLILILGAVACAWGVLSLWKATQSWFGKNTALLAAWLFALYPESILLGSSQMREAIIIPMIALTFFGINEIYGHKLVGWLWIILSAIVLLLIQPLAGLISFVILIGVWLFDPFTMHALQRRRTILTILPLASLVVVAMFIASSILVKLPSLQGSGPLSVYFTWFRNNFTFQSHNLELNSGIFQSLLASVGAQWRWLITLVYGIAQPVLPATVGDPTAATIMRIIGFLRAAGWYFLALFLVYGAFHVIGSRHEQRWYQLVWIGVISWAWIMVSALNAGADQWDNPRYRAILLLWQVILAAWAWDWARKQHDAWLWRWLAVEAVFVGFFTEWYLGRYYPGFFHLNIILMSIITLITCALILIGGVVWDHWRKIKPAAKNSGL